MKILEKELGQDNPAFPTCLNSFGNAYLRMGDKDYCILNVA